MYDFLACLYSLLDEVRSRLLGIKPLPPIDEVVAKVRREEQRKKIMLGPILLTPGESFALVANDGDTCNHKSFWCDHCQKPYHTKATYWRLHGKPAD